MEILKKQIGITAMMLLSFSAWAQSDATIQKAFRDSYTQENNKLYGEAIATLNKVYEENNYEINLRLGWLFYNNKNYTQSQNYYAKAVSLKPYAIEAKFGLIKPLYALENWDKVLSTYEDILKVDAQNVTANYWVGVIQYNRKKYEQAARHFEKVVNLYPFDYDSNHMLAWTYLNLGKNNDAKTLFNKALIIRPADSSSLEGLSKIK
ncbi:MAG: tetratricopeptide repeat protein [Chitinophagaceae bacterium]|nr:tetratricopeptide repeat protein [Chitinophagaceae bacterium]